MSAPAELPKLAAPAQRALAGQKLTTLASVASHGRSRVAALHGMGPNAMARLDAAMKDHGLEWGSG